MKNLTNLFKHAPDSGAPAAAQSAQQQNIQQTVMNNPRGAENRRKLQTASYSQNSNVVIDIPRDTSLKRMLLSAVGSFTVTYGAGSPTLSPWGVFARLCPNFYVVADGSRQIKVLDLFMQRCMNSIVYGSFPRRAYKTGAGLTSTSDLASTEWFAGTVAYPATTQDIVINEQICIDFENPLAWQNKEISQLYTRNLQTCNMTFGFGNISNIQTDGVGATVTYSNISFSVTPTIIENREGVLAQGAFDFNEFVTRKTYSSQQSNSQYLLNAGNKIVGIGIMAQDGTPALAMQDNVLTDISLYTNGVQPQVQTRFRDLSNDNKMRYGLSDDQYAAGLRGLSGFAYIPLLKNGDGLSGLDTQLSNGTSTAELQISTQSAGGVNALTYTAGVTVSVLQQQMVPVPVKN